MKFTFDDCLPNFRLHLEDNYKNDEIIRLNQLQKDTTDAKKRH